MRAINQMKVTVSFFGDHASVKAFSRQVSGVAPYWRAIDERSVDYPVDMRGAEYEQAVTEAIVEATREICRARLSEARLT